MTTHAERLREIADWHDELNAMATNTTAALLHCVAADTLRAAAEAFEKLGHAEDCETQRMGGHPCNCPQGENAS